MKWLLNWVNQSLCLHRDAMYARDGGWLRVVCPTCGFRSPGVEVKAKTR